MVFTVSIVNKKDQSNKDILIMFCDSTLDPIPSRTVKSLPFIEKEAYIYRKCLGGLWDSQALIL